MARVRAQGRAAEQRALALLEAEGFSVEAIQPTAQWPMTVNGSPVDAEIRADYLVRLGRKRFVAEVKSGKVTRASHRDTRRQLLEYRLAFPVHGALLVDMERENILEVRFPRVPGTALNRHAWGPSLTRWAMAAAFGGALGIALARHIFLDGS